MVEPVGSIACRENQELGIVQLEGLLEILLTLDPRRELDRLSKRGAGGSPLLVRRDDACIRRWAGAIEEGEERKLRGLPDGVEPSLVPTDEQGLGAVGLGRASSRGPVYLDDQGDAVALGDGLTQSSSRGGHAPAG